MFVAAIASVGFVRIFPLVAGGAGTRTVFLAAVVDREGMFEVRKCRTSPGGRCVALVAVVAEFAEVDLGFRMTGDARHRRSLEFVVDMALLTVQ